MVNDPDVGETFTAVIVHPNNDDERDPVAKVNGKATYVRFPDHVDESDVEFGDSVKAKMADKRENHNLATAIEVL